VKETRAMTGIFQIFGWHKGRKNGTKNNKTNNDNDNGMPSHHSSSFVRCNHRAILGCFFLSEILDSSSLSNPIAVLDCAEEPGPKANAAAPTFYMVRSSSSLVLLPSAYLDLFL